jgi:hypothetical protein
VILGLAAAALIPRSSRIPVLGCWLAALVAAALAVALSRVTVDLGSGAIRPGLGFFVVVLQGAWITATVLAAGPVRHRLTGKLGRTAATVAVAALAAVPVTGMAWFTAGQQNSFNDEDGDQVPAYMTQSSLRGPAQGVLIVSGAIEDGLTYHVRRGDGTTVGDSEIAVLTPPDEEFTAVVQALTARPTAGVARSLGQNGIEYIVLPPPVDGRVAATLDATPGLTQASAGDQRTRAWQVERDLADTALQGPISTARTGMVALQGVAVALVLILCAPSWRRRRDAD